MNSVNQKKHYILDGCIKLEEDCKKKNNLFNFISQDKKIFEYSIDASENCKTDNQNLYYFTGRISNKSDYTDLLSNDSCEVNKVSNINIVARGYELYGEKFFERLRGKYSIVIIDKLKNQIMLIRDRSGLIPLYFYNDKSTLFFSINLIDLLNYGFKKILNKEKIIEYFSLYNFSKNSTFYKGINRVEANSILSFDINKSMKMSARKVKTKDQLKDINMHFIDIFKRSINFNKSKKTGVILSGGIDSASIACLIRDNYKESQFSTYSIDYDSDNYLYFKKSSEKKYQDIIKNEIQSTHNQFDGSEFNPIEESELFLEEYGQPFYFPNSYIFNWICQKAKKDKVKVLYSGIGGDTTVSWGYESIRERFFKLKLFDFYKELKLLSKNKKVSRKTIIKRILFDDLLDIYLAKIKSLISGKPIPMLQPPILKKEFLYSNSKKYKSLVMPPLTAQNYHKYVVNAPDHQNINELIFPIFNNNNIEHISPFYDEDLINTCLKVSPYLKLKNGYERYYFRENMKGIVPEEIRLRQEKADIGIAFLINFKNNFSSESKDFINNMHHFLKEIINLEILEQYMAALKTRDEDIYKKSNEISIIYMINIFDTWMKGDKEIEY